MPALQISALATYPIKSGHAVTAASFPVSATGLPYDRHWLVTDEDGVFVTQRNLPAMVRLLPHVDETGLLLTANGESLHLPWPATTAPGLSVRVWDDESLGFDLGDAAAAFLSKHLGLYRGRGLRLRHVARWRHTKETADGLVAPFAFADSMPFLLTSASSLADLNQRLQAKGEAALPMNRFRPNLVLRGLPAFAEHEIQGLRIGEGIELRMTKACTRCRITMTDQDTGALGSEPLNTLGEYRRDARGKIIFGHYAVLVRGEGVTVRVGDPVVIL